MYNEVEIKYMLIRKKCNYTDENIFNYLMHIQLDRAMCYTFLDSITYCPVCIVTYLNYTSVGYLMGDALLYKNRQGLWAQCDHSMYEGKSIISID